MASASKFQAVRAYLVMLMFLLCLVLCASVFTFDPADWPSTKVWPNPDPVNNACGKVGAFIAYYLFYWIGEGVYPLMFFATLAAIHLLIHGFIQNPWQRIFGVAVLIAGTATAVRLVSPGDAHSMLIGNGGILGAAIAMSLMENFKPLGTWIILLYGMMVGLLFAAEGWVLRLPAIAKKMSEAAGVGAVQIAKTVNVPRPVPLPTVGAAATRILRDYITARRTNAGGINADRRATARDRSDDPNENPKSLEPKINPNRPAPPPSNKPAKSRKDPDGQSLFDQADSTPASAPDLDGEQTISDLDSAPERGDTEADPAVTAAKPSSAPPDPPPLPKAYPTELEIWEYPPLNLLEDMEYIYSAQQETVVREKAKILERTLAEFRYEARVVEIDTGPVITMFELQLAAGIKVSQIAALSNDIARALKAPAVRVVAPIPGKNTIGIEVPNLDKEKVRLRELMNLAAGKAKKMALPVFIGKDASGNALIGDLAAMPHMLIAGTTGSGKSVCINSIITSILMTRRPDMVKLILIDPKMVELAQFSNLPHLMCPIVTDLGRAETILEWATTKMDERYELLAEAGVRNIAAYNRLTKEEIYERFQPASEEEEAQIPRKLAYNVIIVDELADLMMTAGKEVEHHLSRLAQKSRAVGIHIVVATQRPEAKVVTGLIKSNLPCRIAFRVASRMDSRIVLDQNGAEVLMGQGDMLYLPPGTSKLVRAQGTFIEDFELKRVLEFVAQRAEPEFHPELIKMRSKGSGNLGERDELFNKAVEIILQTKRGSVSLLQRRLMVGYSRASRLIDQMAEAGIVGEYKGSQAREITITLDEWKSIQSGIAADQAAGFEADADDYQPDATQTTSTAADAEGVTPDETYALLNDEAQTLEETEADYDEAEEEGNDETGYGAECEKDADDDEAQDEEDEEDEEEEEEEEDAEYDEDADEENEDNSEEEEEEEEA